VRASNLFKSKRAWIAITVMLILSPVFGVILADMVGYHEPLDLAAEIAGLRDVSEEVNWTPFFDYSVPGPSGGGGLRSCRDAGRSGHSRGRLRNNEARREA
jgi:hypothetical protein